MLFEYDPDKSAANKAKHGIDFEEAKALWEDEQAVTATARSEIEPRFLVIGRIHEVFWTAVVTERDETTRIISVRRARDNECQIMQKSISAEEFDRKFDDGEDISEYVDWENARPLRTTPRRVNVDFPAWVVEAMDREAERIGITRQAFIKVVIVERLGELGRG